MKPVTVWFNKYLSNTSDVLATLQASRRPNEFRLLCTHPRARYSGKEHSDVFEQEPDGLSHGAYVDYCLDVARRHEVTLFLPGRNLIPIARAQTVFESLGVQVLAAAPVDMLELLASKARVYAALESDPVRLPAYEVVHDLAGFDAAWKRLRPHHSLLCFKPAVSVYGIGFHVVVDRAPTVELPPGRDSVPIRLEEARSRLAEKGRFRDLLVMEYLAGPERSVDCLAHDGELIRCVVRRKEFEAQVLEDNPELVATVRRLTARFRLSNLFNVQFRDSGGRSYLLEINPRMSGGLPLACHSGLVLPYWAIRLALGTATHDEVPEPRLGMRVPQPLPMSSL